MNFQTLILKKNGKPSRELLTPGSQQREDIPTHNLVMNVRVFGHV
jgi:hypothetical protein